jgi:cyclopropane fatty-acyl-phospholipid synthase-like methyltransferase
MSLLNPLSIDIFEAVLFLVEFLPYVVAVVLVATFSFPTSPYEKGRAKCYFARAKGLLQAVVLAVLLMISGTFLCSWESAYRNGYSLWAPSLRQALDTYILTGGNGGVATTVEDIIETDKHYPSMGVAEMKYLLKDLLGHTVFHLDTHNEENIAEGYNKGNDWFEATLGETMTYTSALYEHGNETLEVAQKHKLNYVANAIDLRKGDKLLDIGCGWGFLVKYFTEEYGVSATGITLSSEQRKYGLKLNGDNGATIHLQDAMKIKERTDLPVGGFDKITSLEMAEHVGIRRYQSFLQTVHDLLKDDGVFYFQVAGLRRSWRYEDLVWGLFMGEHIFPGADASCPLGWVSTQLERAGFEIQQVSNYGTHYSRTLAHWLVNWRANKDVTVAKYGEVSYRRWEVFLAWSVRIARQGSSTVFMFTLTKAGQESRRIETQALLAPVSKGAAIFTSTVAAGGSN